MPSARPPAAPASADAVVLLVDDWPGTFAIPDDAEERLHPGPAWVAPAGAALGLVLAVAVRWAEVRPAVVCLLAGPAFVAAVVAAAFRLGGPRGSTTATALATAAWVVMVTAVLVDGPLDERLVAAFVLVGVAGEAWRAAAARARLATHRAAVHGARGGTRREGWVVAASGLPWDSVLRVEPSDGEGGPWTGTNDDWRTVHPGVGHPVSIWRGDQPGRAVVLLPRDPR
ncbi:hypothetical protein AB6N24_21855 [Cellulomonas sp. 179-A 4D5 NHS]|uniref:hypothetical protein n=1 Tax=Cellulomonas sp. 179-A 4D5 NHS TaxID=3142378 RepID=UPI0039A1FF9E